MSQQMNYDEGVGERQTPPYQGYQAGYQDPFIASSGQKLSSRDFGRGASAGQRLALAIVSIVMLVGATAIIFGDSSIIVTPFLMLAFGMICLTIIAVNAIFNITRWEATRLWVNGILVFTELVNPWKFVSNSVA